MIEGVFRTLLLILQSFSPSEGSSSHEAKEDVRLRLGRWLALALEFLLAADILRTMNDRKITQMFVLDDGKPVGIIHMHDLLKAGLA
mgnify:CR=1 FL=1